MIGKGPVKSNAILSSSIFEHGVNWRPEIKKVVQMLPSLNLHFLPEPFQALKPFQVQKATAVGLASILFFGMQWCYSWPLAAGIGLACSAVTVLSEAFLRQNDDMNTDWTNRDFDRKSALFSVALRLTLLPAIVGLATASGILPLQSVGAHILAGNKKIILLAALIGPIAEEILFRGFLQERMEDLANLADRHLSPLPQAAKEWFAIVSQTVLFGSLHITGTQVVNQSKRFVVFCSTSFLGLILTLAKKEDKSLLSPIAIHSAQNSGIVLGLLGGSRLGKALC